MKLLIYNNKAALGSSISRYLKYMILGGMDTPIKPDVTKDLEIEDACEFDIANNKVHISIILTAKRHKSIQAFEKNVEMALKYRNGLKLSKDHKIIKDHFISFFENNTKVVSFDLAGLERGNRSSKYYNQFKLLDIKDKNDHQKFEKDEYYPLRNYFNKNLDITINTDNPFFWFKFNHGVSFSSKNGRRVNKMGSPPVDQKRIQVCHN